jgi:hypothetical protein
MTAINFSGWPDVVLFLARNPAGSVLRLLKGVLPHPKTFGMTTSIGLPEGQRADYRKRLASGAGFHVKDFGAHYEAHLDRVHPDLNLVEHLRVDAPGTFIAGGAALGALAGLALGGSKDNVLVGAALGGLLSAIALENQAQAKPGNPNARGRKA